MNTLKRLAGAVALSAALLILAPTTTYADEVAEPVAAAAVEGHSLVLSEQGWSVLIGVVLPFLVGLGTKYATSARVKALVGALAALIAAVVSRRVLLPDGSWALSLSTAYDAALLWLLSSTAYASFYRKVFGDDFNKSLAPKFGI